MSAWRGIRATGVAAGRSTRGPPGGSLRRLASIPVVELAGVSTAKAAALGQRGITSVLDLLLHHPRRHIDRTNQRAIAELRPGEEALVLAVVDRADVRRVKGGRTLVQVDLRDGAGGRGVLRCTFFNQPWRAKQLSAGTNAVLFGKVEAFGGRLQMTNPVVDLVGDRTGRIVPIYPQSEKVALTTWEIGGWVREALERAGALADPVPADVLAAHRLVGRTAAFHGHHLPQSMGEVTAARTRLVFDELLRVQVALVARKRLLERTSVGFEHRIDGPMVRSFLAGLPFELTDDQRQALHEIGSDLAAPVPMHRLLQGEVGSGKTVVAVAALVAAVEGGHQGALMAPTEVLAEQHHQSVTAMLDEVSLEDEANLFGSRRLAVALLTNRTTAAERGAHGRLGAGEVDHRGLGLPTPPPVPPPLPRETPSPRKWKPRPPRPPPPVVVLIDEQHPPAAPLRRWKFWSMEPWVSEQKKKQRGVGALSFRFGYSSAALRWLGLAKQAKDRSKRKEQRKAGGGGGSGGGSRSRRALV
jgi:ATP-dependent DNA helicase RecG